MTIASKLSTINNALYDIKFAILSNGQSPNGNITTYANAISNISGGGSINSRKNYSKIYNTNFK